MTDMCDARDKLVTTNCVGINRKTDHLHHELQQKTILLSKEGPGTSVMPAAGDTSMLNTVGYFMHKGGHTVLPSDWEVFIRYMKKHL